jgi:hypothetical protein
VTDTVASVPFFEVVAIDHLLGACAGLFRERYSVVQVTVRPPYGAVAAVTLDLEDARRLHEQLGVLLEAEAAKP